MDLAQLKRKRGYCKATLTNLNSFMLTYIKETQHAQLKLRLEKAETILEKFEEIQFEIESLDKDELEKSEDTRTAFEQQYYDTIGKARDLLEGDMSSIQGGSTTFTTPVQTTHIKLPTLILPSFDGDYAKWLTFKDSFASAIHNNDVLTNTEKFRYLRGTLKNEALQTVAALETTDENYVIAWNTLQNRYENHRLIIHTHMKALFDLPIITKESYISLRQMIDNFQMHVNALKALKEPVDTWDTILIHLISSKLDSKTKRDWETEVGETYKTDQKPKLEDFKAFLSNKCQVLEVADKASTSKPEVKPLHKKQLSLATVAHTCVICKGDHYANRCEQLLKLTAADRRTKVKEARLCQNCLRLGHYVKDCKSQSTCKKCARKHNTILHFDNTANERRDNEIQAGVLTNHMMNQNYDVLLSTAIVDIVDSQGRTHKARILLDSGSQSSFITKKLADKLGLKWRRINIPVHGINNALTKITNQVKVEIKSRHEQYKTIIDCLILDKITGTLPPLSIEKSELKIPKNIVLADAAFNLAREIDILIGADIFWELLCTDRITLGKGQPVIQKTRLGWIITGPIQLRTSRRETVACFSQNGTLEENLEQFWRIEEFPKRKLTAEDWKCEKDFVANCKRNSEGRFIVGLPKKENMKMGNSQKGTISRFYHTEKRLNNNPQLRRQYIEFMDAYETLQHMTELPSDRIANDQPGENFYLPHHPVLKEESLSTKLRVVFDGSFKTDNSTSLNDHLLVGPTIQDDLIDIILRFRTYHFVITADIAMMFRQILIREEDRRFQRICWRKDPNETLKFYSLNTVTYGTASAPFLAARTLRQLAIEDGDKFPLAKRALENDFYMDDVLTGANTIEETIELQEQLRNLLALGCFTLRKWRANHNDILRNLVSQETTEALLVIDKEHPIKTLGLLWDSKSDTITYSIKKSNHEASAATKRSILSRIATIYDPLGLLGPVVIKAKIIMQQLWQTNHDWDELIPESLRELWLSYSNSLVDINSITIPRNVNVDNIDNTFDIHGFCDASIKAYGACLYVVSENTANQTTSNILCAKSRVAPLKTISLPRLELNAALILARLVDSVKRSLKDRIRNIYLWSDSTIVLSWIKTSPAKLKVFVANRITEIQNQTMNARWQHINTADNPADVLSRGATPDQLKACSLWWTGPTWMYNNDWPSQEEANNYTTMEEHKAEIITLATTTGISWLSNYSSFEKLINVVAYCMRFINNCKRSAEERQFQDLTVEERIQAQRTIIRLTQEESFAEEFNDLRKQNIVSKSSKVRTLNPYLDEYGIIRVGGRLANANIPLDHKHPYLLPHNHHVTRIIIRHEHQRLLHCGQEQLLAAVRTKFWPVSGRSLVRKIIHECTVCFRYKPHRHEHLMGELPKERVAEGGRPFSIVGVDYAGPIQLKQINRRGRPLITKGYIALFVCLATKAIHIELVTDLTTECFLAALRRFMARRGMCSEIFSDNATNFVGAHRKLKEIHDFLSNNQAEIQKFLCKKQIKWHFIPPRGPHFGGLWESNIKSMKTHFYKITKNVVLTFEEAYTLLVEIESIMNSRPLCPLSSDPSDPNPLTPAHFLIGDHMLEPCNYQLTQVPINRLSRWEHLTKMKQHFWERWRREYLHNLQTRTKWNKDHPNLQVGDLVILIEDNVPALRWPTGRITEVHPGQDGIVRVVSVKCANGSFKRPVRKLCLLPVPEVNNERRAFMAAGMLTT